MRLRLPLVIPLEVWDLPVAGRLLQGWRSDPAFDVRLAAVARSIREAPPSTFSARARAAAAEIAHVHLVGGGATDATSATITAHCGLSCTRSAEPFAPARAGATLRPDALCADVGQTAIKLVHRDREWRVERDLVRAPMRDDVPDDQRASARASTVQFLGMLLASNHATRIVLALPCELDEAGVPRSCTYCWRDPDPDLVPELVRMVGCSIEIVNDAELAALAATAHGLVPRDRTTLVLTVGFGVGAALLLPRP